MRASTYFSVSDHSWSKQISGANGSMNLQPPAFCTGETGFRWVKELRGVKLCWWDNELFTDGGWDRLQIKMNE